MPEIPDLDCSDTPDSLTNEISRDLQNVVPRTVDGKYLHSLTLSGKDEKAGWEELPGEVLILEVDSREDATDTLIKIGAAGLRLASEDDLEGLGAIPTVKVLPFSHENGEGIRRRFGEEKYQVWLKGIEDAKRADAACRARNAALAANQAAWPKKKSPERATVTVKLPGQTPEVFEITANPPRLSFWARTKALFTKPFGRKS